MIKQDNEAITIIFNAIMNNTSIKEVIKQVRSIYMNFTDITIEGTVIHFVVDNMHNTGTYLLEEI